MTVLRSLECSPETPKTCAPSCCTILCSSEQPLTTHRTPTSQSSIASSMSPAMDDTAPSFRTSWPCTFVLQLHATFVVIVPLQIVYPYLLFSFLSDWNQTDATRASKSGRGSLVGKTRVKSDQSELSTITACNSTW